MKKNYKVVQVFLDTEEEGEIEKVFTSGCLSATCTTLPERVRVQKGKGQKALQQPGTLPGLGLRWARHDLIIYPDRFVVWGNEVRATDYYPSREQFYLAQFAPTVEEFVLAVENGQFHQNEYGTFVLD